MIQIAVGVLILLGLLVLLVALVLLALWDVDRYCRRHWDVSPRKHSIRKLISRK